MHSNRYLYLASSSYSRQYLLHEVGIPFTIIPHHFDESQCAFDRPVTDIVSTLAEQKMQHVQIPQKDESAVIWALSADTLSCDVQGTIHGKPVNYADAMAKICALREGAYVYTGFCVQRQRYENGTWHVEKSHTQCVESFCLFDVPDAWIDTYLTQHPTALKAAGAIAIEQYGLQFLKNIHGSYTSIIGLPLYEVRQILDTFGFFTQ